MEQIKKGEINFVFKDSDKKSIEALETYIKEANEILENYSIAE